MRRDNTRNASKISSTWKVIRTGEQESPPGKIKFLDNNIVRNVETLMHLQVLVYHLWRKMSFSQTSINVSTMHMSVSAQGGFCLFQS